MTPDSLRVALANELYCWRFEGEPNPDEEEFAVADRILDLLRAHRAETLEALGGEQVRVHVPGTAINEPMQVQWCNICGPYPRTQARRWCDLGCGSDYNAITESKHVYAFPSSDRGDSVSTKGTT